MPAGGKELASRQVTSHEPLSQDRRTASQENRRKGVKISGITGRSVTCSSVTCSSVELNEAEFSGLGTVRPMDPSHGSAQPASVVRECGRRVADHSGLPLPRGPWQASHDWGLELAAGPLPRGA